MTKAESTITAWVSGWLRSYIYSCLLTRLILKKVSRQSVILIEQSSEQMGVLYLAASVHTEGVETQLFDANL